MPGGSLAACPTGRMCHMWHMCLTATVVRRRHKHSHRDRDTRQGQGDKEEKKGNRQEAPNWRVDLFACESVCNSRPMINANRRNGRGEDREREGE